MFGQADVQEDRVPFILSARVSCTVFDYFAKTERGLRIEGWSVAGSSPWEWETFQRRAPDVGLTFLVVSAYDLNEHFICDFHADTVPPTHTLADLWQSEADWHFAKRVLTQYPL